MVRGRRKRIRKEGTRKKDKSKVPGMEERRRRRYLGRRGQLWSG